MEKVVILATTPAIPNDTVFFTRDVPEDVRQKIVATLLEISKFEEGKAALDTFYWIEGLRAAEDTIYDALRADGSRDGIGIEDLVR